MGEQVCPSLTSSEQTNSARLNQQETNPLNSNISSSSAEIFCSSSAVVGVWEEEANEDDEESEEGRRMRSNSCSKPRFSLNQISKLDHPSLLINGYQHPLLHPMLLALQTWDISLLK